MLIIDGSFGEGGGQIVRTSLSLSAITGSAVTIENIRAGREKPGLRPQHLTGALAIVEICRGDIEGAEVGSSKLVFHPHAVKGGSYEFDVSKTQASAGSVNLILQTIIWPLAFAQRRSRVVIKGGTHIPYAPTSDYIDNVFLPTVARMGLPCDYHVAKCGHYPEGGGEVRFDIRPVEALRPIKLNARRQPLSVDLTSAVSNLPLSIAQRQMDAGMQLLTETFREQVPETPVQGCPETSVAGEIKQYPSPGKGTLFFALARSGDIRAGFQSLGELKKRAEKVATEACEELLAYVDTGKALDKHLADQLIVPMALAGPGSSFTTCEITQHLLTNIAVVEKFLDGHFHISHGLGQPGSVELRH